MSVVAKTLLAIASVTSVTSAHAAIALDRTRAIFPGDQKSISLTITNENKAKPYLAQSWLENAKGEKISTPLAVMPPLQRVESGKKSLVRVNDVAAATLPQDRESVYWLNIREVPPKSDKSNVIQVALQTRIKVFYRPAGIIPERFSRWDDQLILRPVAGGYEIENPTPYYMTIAGITGSAKEAVDSNFRAVMIEPKSTMTVKSKSFATPYVTTINDFGGKPRIPFNCSGGICKGVIPEKSS
ncbi:fimbrial biogenesis chaperone [Enterobacter asburiae]|uniref:fimbrial biogenesis chaperone n=1 Tax=Enterobacter asburiae TaxID=61645 RepID=UPI000A27105C|nr:molecular chaperone [Enterobacter asburiae]